jgi:hypothetical protein
MEKKPAHGPAQDASETPLPAERAFVVQFRAPAAPGEVLFAGRAEHIASGAAARFHSTEDLIAFITKVLASAGAFG